MQAHFNLALGKNLIKVIARILLAPSVLYNKSKLVNVRAGGWDMNDVEFNKGASLTRWSYVLICHPGPHNPYEARNPTEIVKAFTTKLKRPDITASEASQGRKLVLNSPDDPNLETVIRGAVANF